MTPFRALKVYKKAGHRMCNLKKPPAPNTVKLEVSAKKIAVLTRMVTVYAIFWNGNYYLKINGYIT